MGMTRHVVKWSELDAEGGVETTLLLVKTVCSMQGIPLTDEGTIGWIAKRAKSRQTGTITIALDGELPFEIVLAP